MRGTDFKTIIFQKGEDELGIDFEIDFVFDYLKERNDILHKMNKTIDGQLYLDHVILNEETENLLGNVLMYLEFTAIQMGFDNTARQTHEVLNDFLITIYYFLFTRKKLEKFNKELRKLLFQIL